MKIPLDVDYVNIERYGEGMPSRPAAPRRKRKSQYHHGDLRRALIDQAVLTIRNKGVAALTLRSVGSALGVSRTALYRHFADKSALLAAVATEGFRLLHHETAGPWESGGGGRAGFEAMGRAYVRFAITNPAHYRVMFGGFVDASRRDDALVAEAAGAFQVLVDSLIEQQRRGLIRHEDPVSLGRFIWALVHGIAMLAIDGQLGDDGAAAALADFAVTHVYPGIGTGG
jgi:AcrR family transcriptional regulator